MWSIKGVKKEANQILKKNYLVLVFLCAVLLFLGILPGNGTELITMNRNVITGEEISEEEADKYRPGLVRYLDSIAKGESKARQLEIVEEVIETSKGRGGNVYGIMRAIDQFFFAHDTAAKLLIIVSLFIYLFFWFFIGNALLVGFTRISIDAGKPGNKILFSDLFVMFRSNGYLNLVGVMFLWETFFDIILLCAVGLIIGGFTIIANVGSLALAIALIVLGVIALGGFFYLYLMMSLMPYILATNPKATLKESMALSKAMMDGSKWKLAKLRLSYIGWDLLSIPTLGLLNLLYITPSVYMAYGRMYVSLREKAMRDNLPYAYLIEGETEAFLPEALVPNKLGQLIEDKNPIRHYSLINIILMFFVFAFGGWCWEVLIHIVKDGVFVNRGTMHGPWLPIYGFGGAGIVYFLNKLAKKPGLLIASIFVGCGILEYAAHWYLEVTKGTKWWDYSNYFLNLNGRICFEGLFVFCVAGVFAVYVIGPALDNLLNKYPDKKKWPIAIALLTIFLIDMRYSHYHPNVGKGITDYGKKE